MTRPADDSPPARSKGIHIPPEDAAFLVMLVLEAVVTAWQAERRKWSTRRVAFSRDLEYALGHEGGFTTILRRARTKRR